jgi:hypothetical protein
MESVISQAIIFITTKNTDTDTAKTIDVLAKNVPELFLKHESKILLNKFILKGTDASLITKAHKLHLGDCRVSDFFYN